jgi:ADP-dependent NAD(P)H-hydrate dehydratase
LGFRKRRLAPIEPSSVVQLMPLLKSADAVLIGPGLADEHAIAALAAAMLEKVQPGPAFVFDAGAIKHLRAARGFLERHQGRIVVTPHAGEMAGLLSIERSDVESDPARFARQAAIDLYAIVALKGASTFIATTEREPCVCREGNVGLATSGSGDVLAGIITGLLGRGAPALGAACWGVYLHAKAGDRLSEKVGPLGYLARELLAEIPSIMGTLS